MIGPRSVLIKLVALVDRLPLPPPPVRRGKGRPRFYPDRLFLNRPQSIPQSGLTNYDQASIN